MFLNSSMDYTNRSAFDSLAHKMIRGEPGVVRMRAEKMPVIVKLGPFSIPVYGGVTIDQVRVRVCVWVSSVSQVFAAEYF